MSIPGAKVRALLAYLVVSAGEPVTADRLLEELWHGDPPAGGAGAVQTAVSRLRRALDRAEPGARQLVESGPSGYRLRVGPESVDARRFEALVSAARAAGPTENAIARLSEALALWRGPALADHTDAAFAAPAIARWEEQRAVALESRAEARLALGEHASLIGELDELVRRYPLREGLRASHMRALYRAGRQAEALASFHRARTVLADEVGVDPGPELARLHQAILEQSADLEVPEPPVAEGGAAEGRAQAEAPGNLPAALTDLVGRDSAVDDVRALLGEARLVTLTGAGGVGKTSLALAAAEYADARRFRGGVWMVELASNDSSLVGADELATYVACVIGVRDDVVLEHSAGQAPLSTADRLARSVRDLRGLLVLDNCEHIAGAVGALLASLLRAAPGLRVLATSREPLGVPGERLYPVAPLAPPTRDILAEVRRSPAARLFARRAAASVPGFVIDDETAAAVAEICRRLDGLPLALELAAARLRALSVHELAERLDDRFRLLTAGGHGAPARQRTLHAVIDWSWELLSPTERAVLRRLSVHANGFTLAAAESVCAGDGIERGEVLDTLARLVDRSLVVADTTALGTRYRTLESVTAFSRERLAEAGETADLRERHARFFIVLAEESDRRLRGPEQMATLKRLDADGANLRAAMEWANGQRGPDPALRVTGAMSWYWYLHGRYVEGRDHLSAALAMPGPCREDLRARALMWHAALGLTVDPSDSTLIRSAVDALELHERRGGPAGAAEAKAILALVVTVAMGTGDGVLPSAESMAQDAVDTFRALGDEWGLAVALLGRGWAALRRSDLAVARVTADEAYAKFRELRDRWGELRSLALLGVLAEISGSYDEAGHLHRRSLECGNALGLAPAAVEGQVRLARLFLLNRDFAVADQYNEEILRRTEESSAASFGAYARVGLGMSARRQGKLGRAERHLSEALAVHTAANHQAGRASTLAELGFLAEMRGDAAAARDLHLKGLAASEEARDPRAVAQALEGIAGADVLDGKAARAGRLLGAAAAARTRAGAPQPAAERFDVDRITAGATEAIGADRLAAAFGAGERTPLEEAVREAYATRERQAVPGA